MKNKKIILGIILVLIIILSLIFINFTSKKTYIINLPNLDKVVSLSIEYNHRNKYISNKNNIKKVYDAVKKVNKTKQKSEENKPVAGESQMKVTFYYEDSVAQIVYFYKKNDSYYLEEPYNGIYLIDKSIYNTVFSLQ